MSALTVQELMGLRDELVRQLARGVMTVADQNGESVTYASPAAMQRAIAATEARIAGMQTAAPNVIRFQTSKGL
jgi:hypothetical protein